MPFHIAQSYFWSRWDGGDGKRVWFQPDERPNGIQFDACSGACTDSSGVINVQGGYTFVVGQQVNVSPGTYTVIVNDSSGNRASAPFSVTPPTITLNPTSGPEGTAVDVGGKSLLLGAARYLVSTTQKMGLRGRTVEHISNGDGHQRRAPNLSSTKLGLPSAVTRAPRFENYCCS